MINRVLKMSVVARAIANTILATKGQFKYAKIARDTGKACMKLMDIHKGKSR